MDESSWHGDVCDSVLVPVSYTHLTALRGAWQQRNAFADLPVRIVGEAEALTGICAGVDEDGALLLQTQGGLRRVLSGEVSLRLA